MRLWTPRAAPVAFVTLLVVAGCPVEPAADLCSAAPFAGMSTGTLVLADSTGTEWIDGSDVELVFGAQGGFMILPTVEIDGALADGPSPCLRVTLAHRDPAGSAIFSEFSERATNERFTRTISGDLRTDPIFDQLRWTPVPPGTAVELTVTVRGESFAVERTVTLDLVPEP